MFCLKNVGFNKLAGVYTNISSIRVQQNNETSEEMHFYALQGKKVFKVGPGF